MRCFYTTPPPSIPLEQRASGSRRASRQSSSPVDPAAARAARQWISPSIPPELLARIPPSIPPERLASGSRRVSRQSGWSPVCRQSGSPVDPAQNPARAARQWIPPIIPAEQPASAEYPASGSRPVSRQSSSPVDPAEYPTRGARQWIPPSIPLRSQSSSPVDPAEYPAGWILASIRPVSN